MLCTLPSFLYWEVFEPVQGYILACLSNIDNIFTDNLQDLPPAFFECITTYRKPATGSFSCIL